MSEETEILSQDEFAFWFDNTCNDLGINEKRKRQTFDHENKQTLVDLKNWALLDNKPVEPSPRIVVTPTMRKEISSKRRCSTRNPSSSFACVVAMRNTSAPSAKPYNKQYQAWTQYLYKQNMAYVYRPGHALYPQLTGSNGQSYEVITAHRLELDNEFLIKVTPYIHRWSVFDQEKGCWFVCDENRQRINLNCDQASRATHLDIVRAQCAPLIYWMIDMRNQTKQNRAMGFRDLLTSVLGFM